MLKLLTVNGPRSRKKGAPTPKDKSFRHQDFTSDRLSFIFYFPSSLSNFVFYFTLRRNKTHDPSTRVLSSIVLGGMAYGGQLNGVSSMPQMALASSSLLPTRNTKNRKWVFFHLFFKQRNEPMKWWDIKRLSCRMCDLFGKIHIPFSLSLTLLKWSCNQDLIVQ